MQRHTARARQVERLRSESGLGSPSIHNDSSLCAVNICSLSCAKLYEMMVEREEYFLLRLGAWMFANLPLLRCLSATNPKPT
jgi:hypothetical protein